MTVWFKQGVCGDLVGKAQKGLGRVAKLYNDNGSDLFVTSLREANHSSGSFHYIGQAFDIRDSTKVLLVQLKSVLGNGWDVIPERDHIHCEFDPK